jgi:hypothetical protein
MDKKESDRIDKQLAIARSFNKQILNIFRVVDSKVEGNPDIDRLKRLISMCRNVCPLFMIERCKDKIWIDRDHILKENEDYFLNRKFDEYIKKDQNQRFIETLIEMVHDGYHLLSPSEKKCLWKYIKQMLQDCMEFKLTTGDFQ